MEGYRPGLLAEIVGLHMAYYAPQWGFGAAFEAKISADMAAFLQQYQDDRDLLLAVRDRDGALVGSVVIHGPHASPGGEVEDGAHLRWFIVDDRVRGHGLGHALLEWAVRFCDARRYPLCFLNTFAGLNAARHLYESQGFTLVATSDVDQWSGGVQEQRFERLLVD
ncbi:GNAT family N-acetyltransferase [Roseospira marina]|uniref:GNAT family N-acetyltransferase n=1 Tax=Roseospira marina TaxID=140057 RepID=A0A5M6IHP7_9PROT|nr:GNAT family N-acetyltransferase [Roseospira marina]